MQAFAAPFRDPGLPWLFAEGGLVMGAFVTVYNYLAFRLLAPPYALHQTTVAAVFSLYLVGMVSSPLFGEVAGRLGRRRVLWVPVVLMLLGVGLTVLRQLGLVITGVGLLTFGFFGAHSIASTWVGRRSGAHKAAAASLYLLVYYVGSSVAGSFGGVFWSRRLVGRGRLHRRAGRPRAPHSRPPGRTGAPARQSLQCLGGGAPGADSSAAPQIRNSAQAANVRCAAVSPRPFATHVGRLFWPSRPLAYEGS